MAGRGRKAPGGTGVPEDSGSIWGYIEGYYGRLFGWEERAAVVDRLAGHGGGAYLYAPKEDPLHRRDWRIPYGEPWRKRFKALARRASTGGVDLVPGMAPGLSFDYLAAADYRILLGKFRDFQKMGCRTLALLMDDIPAVLPDNCREAFGSLGEAHAILLERLLRDLRASGKDCRLWFCPTVYTDQFASGPVERDPYLVDLAAGMPPEITLMWTGPGIVSERLGSRELGPVSRLFKGNLVIWDNFYANDYCPNKIFLGPLTGRSPDVWRKTRGLLLNPTGHPVTDLLLLDVLAAFRAGAGAGPGWRTAIGKYGLPDGFRTVAPYLASPFFRPGPRDLAPGRIAAARKALKDLIWDWKAPLHQEWYPYLFMLDADLKASSTGKEKPDEAWVRKRYPPLVARLLLRSSSGGK